MSAYELLQLQNSINDLNNRLEDTSRLLQEVNQRLIHLESHRVPAVETELASTYKKITEDMHDSLVAISRASADAMQSALLRDIHLIAAEMIAKHQKEMHNSYTGTASGSAAAGSS